MAHMKVWLDFLVQGVELYVILNCVGDPHGGSDWGVDSLEGPMIRYIADSICPRKIFNGDFEDDWRL